MELYRQNPKLKRTIVETVDGTKEYRINCKKVKDKYYRIDDHIFYIESEDTWYRYESGKIRFIDGKWQLKPIKNDS